MALEINDANFEELVLQSDKPVLVDFWAEWCGPCRMVAPVVQELSEDYAGRLIVGKVDVDSNPGIEKHEKPFNHRTAGERGRSDTEAD